MSKSQAMQLTVKPLTPNSLASMDLVVVAVFEGGLERALNHPGVSQHRELLLRMARDEQFVGSHNQRLASALIGSRGAKGASDAYSRLVLVGMGLPSASSAERWMGLGGAAVRVGQSFAAANVALLPPQKLEVEHAMAIAQGAHMGAYRYDAYRGKEAKSKTQKRGAHPSIRSLVVHADTSKQLVQAIQEGSVRARVVAVARDLVNCPPNVLYPQSFAAAAKKLCASYPIGIKVYGHKELEKMGMGMLLGVGQGSARPPCLVHLRYSSAARKKDAPTLLVGKGITFDSGGLCIKGCDAMGTMKMDMGGAAAVLATVLGAAALKLDVHVHGVLALAENMPSGQALRTGDVLLSYKGLTVEVNNTDAEGRLVLGDALHYGISRCAPAQVVDVATLTGACMVALGNNTTGLFSNNDGLADALLAAAKAGGEHMWRMPLTESLQSELRSEVADMRNTGDRYGGAITAALFLQRFVDQVPWAHLDIAGPAWAGSETSTRKKGGTGAAVSSLLTFLAQQATGPRGTRAVVRGKRDK